MCSRTAIGNVIDSSISPIDKVGIYAASGQLGSEQTLTGDKTTLRRILQNLNFVSAGIADREYPPMNEIQAFMIEQNDPDMILYFAEAIAGSNSGRDIPIRNRDLEMAKEVVAKRAAALAAVSAGITERLLSALKGYLDQLVKVPGRKAIFLLSDGFVLQTHRGDVVNRLGELTTAAARAGIMIYTLDARGLVVGLPDAKTKMAPDRTGALAHSGYSEILPKQDALNALAADTGGRFLKNTNALDTALITTLEEISRYYLLTWQIDPATLQTGERSTIKASIKGRSDLTVRVRQGSLDLSKLAQKKRSQF
jgi:VWFA-related protein